MTRSIDFDYVERKTWWLVPIVFALFTIVLFQKYADNPRWLGFDAALYSNAAGAWLAGGDPWQVSSDGVYFAAPPPSLVPFVPFVDLPDGVVGGIWICGSLILAALAVRALRLPWWWILFPPLVDGVLVGSPDVAMLAALTVAGGRLAAVAPFLKIFAFVPMVAERQWRQIGVALVALAVSLAILPWAAWFNQLPTVTANLASASETTSVFGSPVLMVIAVVALLAVGVRRAGWLSVPLLWPHTQIHYLAIAIPGLAPVMAAMWCYPSPYWLLATTVGMAIWQYFRHPDLARDPLREWFAMLRNKKSATALE